jgi:Tol biopolymer transport system component
MRVTRALVPVLAGVVLATTLTPGEARAGVPTRGRLHVSDSQVFQASPVAVRGQVPGGFRRTVLLQRRVSWGWTSVAKTQTRPSGRFVFRYRTNRLGPLTLRVWAPRAVHQHRRVVRVRTPMRTLEVMPSPIGGDIARVTAGSKGSQNARLSPDGRFVLFDSEAADLVTGDTNGYRDVFLHDRTTGETTRITGGHGSSYAGAISADGRWVAFDSYASDVVPGDTNNMRDVFLYDRDTMTTTRITDGNGGSAVGGLSADGRRLVFASYASDLVDGDTNNYGDVFLYDADTQAITKLTGGKGAGKSPSISADGHWIAFYSGAPNLVPDDKNHVRDVFVYDVEAGTTRRITDGNAASQSTTSSISADGRWVTFYSDASDLVDGDTNNRTDVFLSDLQQGTTTRISQGNSHSLGPVISGDGRRLAFTSYASNLTPGDVNAQADIFTYDTDLGLVARITNGNGPSDLPAISADGSLVAFSSLAADLVAGDTNTMSDVFTWLRTS